MKNAVLAMFLVAPTPGAVGTELGPWHDLHIAVQAQQESMLVNGVPLTISRVTGSDVGVLAQRLRDKWVEESGVHGVRVENQDAWTILSRIRGMHVEVLQWQGRGKDAVLLWSRSELASGARAAIREGLGVPAGCVTGRTVSGRVDSRTFVQQSARCKGSPRNTLAAIRASASNRGFEVLSSESSLLARNRESEITVLAWHSDDASAAAPTSLVYLQLDSRKVAR